MEKAIILTAFDRPEYLERTLETVAAARGLESWNFYANIDPSPRLNKVCDVIEKFIPSARILVNESRLGVLENPYRAFATAFTDHEFVLRLEDDVLISSDALEYAEWAAEMYRWDQGVALVQLHSMYSKGDPETVDWTTDFSPWNWGTWIDRWMNYIGPTWDRDYSTNNGVPGVEAGWDWNLNTRVLPNLNKYVIAPVQSRSEHIGTYGTHGTPETLVSAPLFKRERPAVVYREATA